LIAQRCSAARAGRAENNTGRRVQQRLPPPTDERVGEVREEIRLLITVDCPSAQAAPDGNRDQSVEDECFQRDAQRRVLHHVAEPRAVLW
jgi:hypothetical protein